MSCTSIHRRDALRREAPNQAATVVFPTPGVPVSATTRVMRRERPGRFMALSATWGLMRGGGALA